MTTLHKPVNMITYRLGSFPHLTAQDVLDLIGFRVEKAILRPDVSYDLLMFAYELRELIQNQKEEESAM